MSLLCIKWPAWYLCSYGYNEYLQGICDPVFHNPPETISCTVAFRTAEYIIWGGERRCLILGFKTSLYAAITFGKWTTGYTFFISFPLGGCQATLAQAKGREGALGYFSFSSGICFMKSYYWSPAKIPPRHNMWVCLISIRCNCSQMPNHLSSSLLNCYIFIASDS